MSATAAVPATELEGGRDRQVIREVTFPADIGFDTRRDRVAIPMPTLTG